MPQPAPEPFDSRGGVVVDQGAGGLGDGCQGLWVVAGLAEETGKPVRFNCGAAALPWMDLFDVPGVSVGLSAKIHNELPTPGAVQMNLGYTNERATRIAEPRWERYMRNVGATRMVRPRLRDESGVRNGGVDFRNHVVLCPWSSGRWSEWSVHAWLDLESRLNRAGYPTVVLHKSPDRCERFKGRKLVGRSPDEVAGVMLNAACVVGIDSGLAHLAGTLGVPTVVIGGATDVRRIFGCYPTATCVQGELPCSGCFNMGPDVNDTCRDNCANLHSVTPERVFRAADHVCLTKAMGGKTLISTDRLASIRKEVLATNHMPGDLAELGCYKGGSAKLIRDHSRGTLHLFDTFAGIPDDDAAEGGVHVKGEFAGSLDDVKAVVGTENVEYHVGAFPTGREPDARFRFAHVDLDTYQSTAAALAYLVPRMVPGGVILLDDFGWHCCPGVAIAVREAGLKAERTADYQAAIRILVN
jgi:hypothetical protein